MKNIIISVSAVIAAAIIFSGCSVTLDPSEKALISGLGIDGKLALQLKKMSGFPPSSFHKITGVENEDRPRIDAIALYASSEKADEAVAVMAPVFRAKGFMLLKTQSNNGDKPDEISVLKTKDQFDALRMMGTNGANYDISTEDLISQLKEWQKICSFTIDGAGEDWMSADFIKKPADMKAFAQEVYDFCPDVVDQGAGDADKLAQQMEEDNSLYLWWD